MAPQVTYPYLHLEAHTEVIVGASRPIPHPPSVAITAREACASPPPLCHPSVTFRQSSVPAGPRRPSGSHSRPSSTAPDEQFTVSGQDLVGDKESPITVRPCPSVNIIPPTPCPARQPCHPSSIEPLLDGIPADPPVSFEPSLDDQDLAPDPNVPPPDNEAPPPDGDVPPVKHSCNDAPLNLETDMPNVNQSPPSTPTSGRRSGETLRVLEEGYQELEEILTKIAVLAELTPQQVANAWHKNAGRVINMPNYWNMYQAFFKVHEGQEAARLVSPASGPGSYSIDS